MVLENADSEVHALGSHQLPAVIADFVPAAWDLTVPDDPPRRYVTLPRFLSQLERGHEAWRDLCATQAVLAQECLAQLVDPIDHELAAPRADVKGVLGETGTP